MIRIVSIYRNYSEDMAKKMMENLDTENSNLENKLFLKNQLETLNKIKALNLKEGDKIISKETGTVRTIRKYVEDKDFAGGGFFTVDTQKRDLTTKLEEILPFQKFIEFEEKGKLRLERLKELHKIFSGEGELLADVGDIIISNKGARSKIININRNLQSPEKSIVTIQVRQEDRTTSPPQTLTFDQLKEAEKNGAVSKIQKEDAGE